MSHRFDLAGRVALVTGAGMGIGRRLALGLAGAGASIVVAEIDGATAEAVAAEAGGESIAIATDVTDPAAVERLFATTRERCGRLDILINNAGGGGSSSKPTLELPLSDWRATFDLTLTSAFLCAQQAGRLMIPQGSGKIINIASVYGLLGHDSTLYDRRPDGELPEAVAYLSAKAGVIGLTRALATYWARHNIQVNAIAPGMVKTERLGRTVSAETWERLSARTPMGRPADPDDLVGTAVYLASDASSFVTGQTLAVDGGWSVW